VLCVLRVLFVCVRSGLNPITNFVELLVEERGACTRKESMERDGWNVLRVVGEGRSL